MPYSLHTLTCLDSPAMAIQRKTELDLSREKAAALGVSAVEIGLKGFYVTPLGRKVEIRHATETACANTRSIPPERSLPSPELFASQPFSELSIQVSNETTFGAAQRLCGRGLRPLALNFANGVHPGGGFLRGARAQEEVLCRSSVLYQTLKDDPMYAAHHQRPRPDSTDWAIISPDVPVFRRDDGVELETPWLLSVITCAAPYAPTIGQPESGDLLERRIHRVLALAKAFGYTALVLGAWGCGAFANDPWRTARDFRSALQGEYAGAFSDVLFAIADWSTDRKFLGPFRDVFEEV